MHKLPNQLPSGSNLTYSLAAMATIHYRSMPSCEHEAGAHNSLLTCTRLQSLCQRQQQHCATLHKAAMIDASVHTQVIACISTKQVHVTHNTNTAGAVLRATSPSLEACRTTHNQQLAALCHGAMPAIGSTLLPSSSCMLALMGPPSARPPHSSNTTPTHKTQPHRRVCITLGLSHKCSTATHYSHIPQP